MDMDPDPMSEPEAMTPGTMDAPTLEAGNTQLRVNWTPPENNGGSEITAYELRHSDNGGSNWSDIITVTAPATSTAITELTNNTAYVVQVRARNSADGTGEWSESSMEATPIAAVPTEPTAFMLTAGDVSITATWAAPEAGDYPDITGYELHHREVGGTWTMPISPDTNTSHTITGLENGTEYEVRVYAVNGQGNGNPATDTATLIGPPAAPTGLTLVSGQQSITAAWTAPTNNGGITGYDLRFRVSAAALVDGDWQTETTTDTSYRITALKDSTALANGTAYNVEVWVRAQNTAGDGAWLKSTPAASVTTADVVPNKPDPPTLTLDGLTGGFTTAWTAPTDNGGSAIDGYNLRYSINDGDWTISSRTVVSTEFDQYQAGGSTTSNDTYKMQIRAHNNVGYSEWSESSNTITIP
ncbi:MAG: fibronectin type III domain-containing protein [Salinispira sp.]